MKMNEHNRNLTDDKFWDRCYEKRRLTLFYDKDFRNYIDLKFISKLRNIGLEKKNICEIGGGDAKILAHLAGEYKNSSFLVIDYSGEGCELATLRAEKENVRLSVYQEDLFSLGNSYKGMFDLVISFGVVEHFTDLSGVLKAKRYILKEGGRMFTVIPNLSSPVYSFFCRKWSPEIYEKHVRHTMDDFLRGHSDAGLIILDRGYVGSVDFNMLAMAIESFGQNKFEKMLYLLMSRFSKLVHFFEYNFFDLPETRMLSPYMYVLSG